MKHAPVANARDKKVMFFAPIQRINELAQSEANRKMPSATVSWMLTSKDFLCLTRAKKGMTKVTSRKPTNREKKAKRVRLLRNAVSGT